MSSAMPLRSVRCVLMAIVLASPNCAQPKDKSETVVCAFKGGNDGSTPDGRLSIDRLGNLYGTTEGGGSFSNGTVFELTSQGNENVLYNFGNCQYGCDPSGALVGSRFHYGTTFSGGPNCDCGTVYRVTADGAETTLYLFQGGSDGANPLGGVVKHGDNLYGTTMRGGGTKQTCTGGCGTVYKITPPDSKETILYSLAAVLTEHGHSVA